jgi:predicted aspartyl protease/Flp pilus assembly protein TadD
MTERIFAAAVVPRLFVRLVLGVVALGLSAQCLYAATCNVLKHAPPTEAETALLAADYAKAESLYRADLAAHPADANATAGLVHTLLHEQKVQEAADVVQTALAARPGTTALITLRGEVELRQGMPWLAAKTANESSNLDPCNPRTHLLLADLYRISSLYASARRALLTAHQLDPEDPEIRGEWMNTLPIKQRIPEIEAYLASPTGDDAEDLRHLHSYLEHLKKLADQPRKSCHLVSPVDTTEIPFTMLMYDANRMRAFGLEVKLNNHSARLEIDTGAGGLLVSRSVARRAGLKPFSQSEMGGIGDEGDKPGYTAYADSIRIGNLEFQDCLVEVLDSSHGLEDQDGLIGMDVFSHFLVTLDYPMRKLALGPLPPRPGDVRSTSNSLNTSEDDADDSVASTTHANETQQDKPAAQGVDAGASADGSTKTSPGDGSKVSAPAPIAHGPFDRYVAPEMKDYTRVYRVGHDLILPAALNGKSIKLFIMDTGAWATTISPQAAREVTKVHTESGMEVHGIGGKVDKLYSADKITFNFANLSQETYGVVAFDTSKISKNVGLEISGFLGATTLRMLTIHIDYRDGLVKFDYNPNRGYKY